MTTRPLASGRCRRAAPVMTPSALRSGGRPGRRGAILVGVLWVLVFLAFLAVVLRIHVGAVVLSVRVTEDKAAARIIAEAGLAQAAAMVRAGPSDEGGPTPDQIHTEVVTASGQVSVTLTNEAWRIDLNTAERPLIVGLLRASGASDGLAETLAERIVERRGGSRPGTAPQQEAPQPSADPFQSTAELALVAGLTPSIALSAETFATVSSGLAGIRLEITDERLLRSIPGLSPATIAAILRYRAGRIDRSELELALGAVSYNTTEQAISWRARLRVDLPSGHGETHEALITMSPEDDAPYRITDWRRITNELE